MSHGSMRRLCLLALLASAGCAQVPTANMQATGMRRPAPGGIVLSQSNQQTSVSNGGTLLASQTNEVTVGSTSLKSLLRYYRPIQGTFFWNKQNQCLFIQQQNTAAGLTISGSTDLVYRQINHLIIYLEDGSSDLNIGVSQGNAMGLVDIIGSDRIALQQINQVQVMLERTRHGVRGSAQGLVIGGPADLTLPSNLDQVAITANQAVVQQQNDLLVVLDDDGDYDFYIRSSAAPPPAPK